MQNLIKFHQFIHKILSKNEILTTTKGHNQVVNFQKRLMHNNPNIELVNTNAYAKSGLIPSIRSQNFEWKLNSENKCCKFAKITL